MARGPPNVSAMNTRRPDPSTTLLALPGSQDHGSRDRRGERGAAVAELAMVIPMMLLLLVVVFDFGRGFVAYVSIKDGARDGARVALHVDKTCDDDAEPAAEDAAAPYAVDVAVAWNSTAQSCTVTVTHAYSPVIPYVTAEIDVPGIGRVGPLWDGTITETAVSYK